ncbi:MAG: hypothetical protein OHK0029_26700 [Armatimonadaceae bacterium]
MRQHFIGTCTAGIAGFVLLAATQLPVSSQPPFSGGGKPQPKRVRSSEPRPRVNPTPPLAPDSPLKPAYDAMRAGDAVTAARLLSRLHPDKLTDEDGRRWRILSGEAAVRSGDRALLARVRQRPEHLLFVSGRQIMNAWEHAQVGNYERAKVLLERVDRPEYLDERSRRRYLALHARIAEAEGDLNRERIYIAKLVDYMGHWRSELCQACHENPEKYGDDITSLDVNSHWIGQRFSAILEKSGDAAMVRKAAEIRLAADREDEGARLRRAYALRAEKRETEAVSELQHLTWAVFPNRPYKEPLDRIEFPGRLPLPVEKRRPESEFAYDNLILTASDYLKAGEFDRCRTELADLPEFDVLTPRQRVRALAVRARLERLTGNRAAEYFALQRLLREAKAIAPQAKTGDGATLRGENWWVTKRFAELAKGADATEMDQHRTLPLNFTGDDLPSVRDLTQFP